MSFREATIEERLDDEAPLDFVGNIAEEARNERYRGLQYVAALLAVCLLASVAANYKLATRPAITRWVRIDELGRATPIVYSDLNFTPQAGDIRRDLMDWAELRYSRIKSNVVQNYRRSYLFIDNAYASSLMQEDDKSKEVLNVITGTQAENNLDNVNAQITDLSSKLVAGAKLTTGSALIDFDKVFLPSGSDAGHREHWQASVTFYLNPDAVSRMAAKRPEYERYNPEGLVITEILPQRTMSR